MPTKLPVAFYARNGSTEALANAIVFGTPTRLCAMASDNGIKCNS